MILWGPPGSGKTTLAHVVAQRTEHAFERLNAVLGGVAELREIVQRASERPSPRASAPSCSSTRSTASTSAQQDAFLPHVENGTMILIGATTENPSFAVNAALLSRCKVFRLEALEPEALESILDARAGGYGARARQVRRARASREALAQIARASRGDARRALGCSRPPCSSRSVPGGWWTCALFERCQREQHAALRQGGRGALQRRQRVHQIDARHRSGRGHLLDDAHARGRRRSALRVAAHDDLRQRGRGQRRPARARGRRQRRRRLPPHGYARGALPDRPRLPLSGELPQVERREQGVARRRRPPSRSTARCPCR